MRSPDAFRYPSVPHKRRHGPQASKDYADYRDWLRDEFDFRCVYCLYRERWSQGKGHFDLDHLVPRKIREDLALTYDNLVYACHTCNLIKSFSSLPDPHRHSFGKCLRVENDGTITALNSEGETLIDELDLDDQHRVEFRALVLNSVRSAREAGNLELIRRWLGLPSNLPDLTIKKPKGGNSRPRGIRESWHNREPKPEIYE